MVPVSAGSNMNPTQRGLGQLQQSSMSREVAPDSGQDVPRRENTARLLAGWLMLVVSGLLLANTVLASAGVGVSGSDWALALLAAVGSFVAARSLWTGARGGWWMAAAYDAIGIFFVLPVMIAILFGGSREPVGTGWDVIFFPAVAAALAASAAALWIARPKRGTGS
jgi:hypothetical protein